MPSKKIIELEKELERHRIKPPGSELASVLNKLAYAYLHSDPLKAKTCALESQELSVKLELPAEQAKSYRMLGMIDLEVGNFAEAMSYCRKSMEIYEKLGDRDGMATVHGTMAKTCKVQGMIDMALEHYHESLRRKQECGASEDDLALCYLNIGVCYGSLLRLDLAQSFYEYARKIWEKSDNRQQLSYLYHNIGCLYGEKKELDKAQEYFQKALDIMEDLGNKTGIANSLCNLGCLNKDLA